MARKSAEQLRKELEAAEALEHEATEGLSEAQAAYDEAFEGIIDGTPEQLEELQVAFRGLVEAVKANWRYRGLPTMTAERRAKAVAATNLSKARKAVEAGTATDEQVELVQEAEARKQEKATA